MQYLVMDLRQRFLGTIDRHSAMAVGDVFQAQDTKSYQVVRIETARSPHKPLQSLTVIAAK
ncbi:MAG: hypothetical protein SFT94_03985 [Pseudanabaenaceae cyanobacterium bins.68]|nr:hypothetical protein [Pseudanabaenaceae cyanobacterium bins.68]